MKNDLDFIRNKIENSGVHAPEDMNEQYVVKMTENVTPKLEAAKQEKPKRKGWKIALSVTAAVLVAVIALTVILRVVGGIGGVRDITFPSGLALKQFGSYQQVNDEVSRLRKAQEKNDFWDNLKGISRALGNDLYAEENGSAPQDYAASGSAKGGSSATSSQSHSETYEQVAGVNEADIIKTDGKYIYCVDGYNTGEIAIFSAQGKDSRRVATIDTSDQSVATEDEADFNYYSYFGYGPTVNEIYLRDDRLVVLSVDWEDNCERTTVQVYDVSDINSITMLDSMSQSGYYSSSRMIGDTLYTVSSYYPYENRILPVCGRGEQPDGVPADCIYTLAGNDSDSFLVLSAYDTIDFSAQTQSKSILGGVDDIYCNEDHMYIYSTVWNNANRDDDWSSDNAKTQILKVDLTDDLSFTAYASVDGQVDDQYALDEHDGNLRIATTTYSYVGDNDTNHLFVLDESLNVIGSVNGFAEGESIKAVRYVGDTAYVITYEQTDPLFVIDLSAPTAPAILGEVKISGFSTMLVPIDENTLLGIGYHTENEDYTSLEVQEGLKLALFDVSDKANPKVLDSKSYLYCDSEVQYNPKALVYNPDRNDFIIPLNYANWGHYDSAKQEYVYVDDYSGGVLNFRADGGKLNEISRFTMDYDAVNRCVYVGDTIYMTHYSDDRLEIDSVKYE